MPIQRRLFIGRLLLASICLLVPNHSGRTLAQSLSGVHIGDTQSQLIALGDPVASDRYKSFSVKKWKFSNENEFSVTQSSTGRIVFLESDWDGQSDDSSCDLAGLKFGVTTLADIRRRFGSNGFGFKNRAVISVPDGVVLFNSYQVGAVVVTFITKAYRDETRPLKLDGLPTAVADRAKLDAISIADSGYAKTEWGERMYDPRYKKPVWK